MFLLSKVAGRVLLGLAVVGFVLSSVSCPVIPELAFLVGSFQNNVRLLVGPWGGCIVVDNHMSCPKTAFGFSLNLVNFPGRTETGTSPIVARLTYAMILFPIASLFAFNGMLLHTFGRTRRPQLFGAVLSGLALAVASAGFAIMFYIFVTAQKRINEQFSGSPAALGPAIWLVVASYTILFFATLLVGGSVEPKAKSSPDAYYSMDSQSEIYRLDNKQSRSVNDQDVSQDYYNPQDYFKEEVAQDYYHPQSRHSSRHDSLSYQSYPSQYEDQSYAQAYTTADQYYQPNIAQVYYPHHQAQPVNASRSYHYSHSNQPGSRSSSGSQIKSVKTAAC